jgi:hypothetical protein
MTLSDNHIAGAFALIAGIATIVGGRAKFHYSGQVSGPAAYGVGLLLLALGAFLLSAG